MISKLSLIKLLEAGEEVCGVCGKVITDKPDCIHMGFGRITSSTNNLQSEQGKGASHQQELDEKQYSLRIGEEVLMYGEEYIESLECLDKQTFDPAMSLYYLKNFYREAYEAGCKLHDTRVATSLITMHPITDEEGGQYYG